MARRALGVDDDVVLCRRRVPRRHPREHHQLLGRGRRRGRHDGLRPVGAADDARRQAAHRPPAQRPDAALRQTRRRTPLFSFFSLSSSLALFPSFSFFPTCFRSSVLPSSLPLFLSSFLSFFLPYSLLSLFLRFLFPLFLSFMLPSVLSSLSLFLSFFFLPSVFSLSLFLFICSSSLAQPFFPSLCHLLIIDYYSFPISDFSRFFHFCRFVLIFSNLVIRFSILFTFFMKRLVPLPSQLSF